jgi:two-component system chemotaxis response regulator CheB
VLEKGKIGFEGDKKSAQEFIEKVKFLSNIKVIHHPLAKPGKEIRIEKIFEVSSRKVLDRIVAIAVSTGGPQMLQQILKRLPKEFPCGIVIVQHISEGFVDGLVEWLNSSCAIKVKVAQDKEEIQPAVAYIAPCGFQMRVNEEKRIRLSDESSYDGHKPSASILLESVARVYKQGAIGVILSGMGADGAMGIKAIKGMGGGTIAQDEKTCVVFGMPRVAIEMGVVDDVLPIEKIPEVIAAKLRR